MSDIPKQLELISFEEPAFIIKVNPAGVAVYHDNPNYEPKEEDEDELEG